MFLDPLGVLVLGQSELHLCLLFLLLSLSKSDCRKLSDSGLPLDLIGEGLLLLKLWGICSNVKSKKSQRCKSENWKLTPVSIFDQLIPFLNFFLSLSQYLNESWSFVWMILYLLYIWITVRCLDSLSVNCEQKCPVILTVLIPVCPIHARHIAIVRGTASATVVWEPAVEGPAPDPDHPHVVHVDYVGAADVPLHALLGEGLCKVGRLGRLLGEGAQVLGHAVVEFHGRRRCFWRA